MTYMVIQELLKNGSNTLLMVTPADLKEFALSVANELSKNTTFEEKKFTPKEFAARYGVSVGTLWRWCNAGILKKTVVGGKVFYRDSDLKKI